MKKICFAITAVFLFITNITSAQLTVTLNSANISCFGMQDGSITANPTGGAAPYTYLWSNQETGQTINSLAAGYYRVEVKDAIGTIVYGEVTLTEPEALQLEPVINVYTNGFNISCYSCFNGSITLTISGGTTPYTHLWSDGSTNKNRWNLGPGNILVVVTDANGCEVNSESMYLNQPERSDWTMEGNSGSNPATNFIGTTDNKDLVFKTNNAERLRINANGNVKINGTLNVSDSITLNNYRQIGYRPAQGNDPEIMSFGKAPVILPQGITMCTNPNLTPTTFQFSGILQSYGTATNGGNTQINAMNLGFDGANSIIDAAGTSPYPYGNNLLLNYYCGHDVGVGNLTSGDLYANHNFILKGAMKLDNGLSPGVLQIDGNGNVSSTIAAMGLNLWETTTSNANNISNSNNGNVGIGNNNPSEKLHVSGGSLYIGSDNNGLIIDDATHKRIGLIKYSGTSREAGIWRVTSQDFEIGRVNVTSLPGTPNSNDFTTDLYIAGNGKVGLGTNTPAYLLHVLATTASGNLAVMKLESESNTACQFIIENYPNSTNAGAKLMVHGDGNFSMFSTSAYNVGSTKPNISFNGGDDKVYIAGYPDDANQTVLGPYDYKLYVMGGIAAREVDVRSGPFPDYVFDDNYAILSLNQLDQFINENNHLPGLPTANEVERDGLKLGAINLKLVEKVEELTLYIIEQNKRIEKLEKAINAIKK